MSKCKYGMQKPVQNVLQQCINGFKRMEKGGIGVANECVQQACEMALKYINELEAKLADSKPVKHGHWDTISDSDMSKTVMCSVCNKMFYFTKMGQLNIDKMPHCPNCGAKMDGGEGK